MVVVDFFNCTAPLFTLKAVYDILLIIGYSYIKLNVFSAIGIKPAVYAPHTALSHIQLLPQLVKPFARFADFYIGYVIKPIRKQPVQLFIIGYKVLSAVLCADINSQRYKPY